MMRAYTVLQPLDCIAQRGGSDPDKQGFFFSPAKTDVPLRLLYTLLI
jgi:hypothetical protein